MESRRPFVLEEGCKLVECTLRENDSGCLIIVLAFTKNGRSFEQTLLNSNPTSGRSFMFGSLVGREIRHISVVSPNIHIVFDNDLTMDLPLF
jgi:hypothetical protein